LDREESRTNQIVRNKTSLGQNRLEEKKTLVEKKRFEEKNIGRTKEIRRKTLARDELMVQTKILIFENGKCFCFAGGQRIVKN
jgi:hypothetical protein